MYMLQQRIKHIKARLKIGTKNSVATISNPKIEVDKKIQKINQFMITYGFTEERNTQADVIQKEWDDRCRQEEIFWRQKMRVQWILILHITEF